MPSGDRPLELRNNRAADTSVDVIFVPGSLCSAALFDQQVLALGRHDGIASTKVSHIADESSIERMAQAVLAEAPKRFVIVGLSLGGIVAAEVASKAPDRVRGLALLDTNLNEPDDAQLTLRRSLARLAATGSDGAFDTIVRDHHVPLMTLDRPRHDAAVWDMARTIGLNGFAHQNEALLHRYDRRPELGRLDMPVLVMCGEQDSLCSTAMHRDLAGRAAGARHALLPAGICQRWNNPTKSTVTSLTGSTTTSSASTQATSSPTTLHRGLRHDVAPQ